MAKIYFVIVTMQLHQKGHFSNITFSYGILKVKEYSHRFSKLTVTINSLLFLLVFKINGSAVKGI